MLYSNPRITESIIEALDRLLQRADMPRDALYDLTIVNAGLRHMQHFDAGAGQQAGEFLQMLPAMLDSLQGAGPGAIEQLQALSRQADRWVTAPPGGDLKDAFIAALKAMDATFANLVTASPDAMRPLLANLALPLMKQHNRVAMFAATERAHAEEVSPGDPLSVENLSAYLREKLCDASASVSDIVTLPGGFGKETTLFSVTSRTFNADLVMRRDTPINVFGNLDCHIAANEFPVVQAMFRRGIPVPEPLWCELAPTIIQGPAYSIVRRVPGTVVGDATGGSGKISADLQRTLAQTIAALHALPPLTELGAIAAFHPARREGRADACVRDHIAAHYQLYLNSPHIATPVMHGLFNWLLTNVPPTEEATTLVHGDFGFHNLLFDDGKLTAVLDWEFGHLGDPAEDIAYIRNMMGRQMDWPAFLDDYGSSGRPVPDERRILFHEIWSHVRNTAATVILGAQFEAGRLRHVKYGMMLYRYVPYWIAQAQALIERWEGGEQ